MATSLFSASQWEQLFGNFSPTRNDIHNVILRSSFLSCSIESHYGVVAVDPTRGRFLELMARIRSPRRVIEIGSGIGYSALWFLKGMGRTGSLEPIEIQQKVADELNAVIAKAGLTQRVKTHVGPALTRLQKLKGPYDIVFIDADKREYPNTCNMPSGSPDQGQ